RQEGANAEKSQLQRDHHGVLEFLRRHLLARALDALGHPKLRQGPAHANDGHRARSVAVALPQRAHRRGVLESMTTKRTKHSSAKGVSGQGLSSARELRELIATLLRLAKKSDADETEVHVDEIGDSLTRFANNAVHQNVAERGVTVSVRTIVDGRTARSTTNRLDEDSLRTALEASLNLAHSQPKDPHLLPVPR